MISTLHHVFAFLPDTLEFPAVVVTLIALAIVALRLSFHLALWVIGRFLRHLIHSRLQAVLIAKVMTGFTALGVSLPVAFEAVVGTVTSAL